MYKFLNHTLEIRNSIPEEDKYLLCCTCCKNPIMLTIHKKDLHNLEHTAKYCYSFDNLHFVGDYSSIEDIITYFTTNPIEAESTTIYIGEQKPIRLVDVFNPEWFIDHLQENWLDQFEDISDWPFSSEEDLYIVSKVREVLENIELEDNSYLAVNVVPYNLLEFK